MNILPHEWPGGPDFPNECATFTHRKRKVLHAANSLEYITRSYIARNIFNAAGLVSELLEKLVRCGLLATMEVNKPSDQGRFKITTHGAKYAQANPPCDTAEEIAKANYIKQTKAKRKAQTDKYREAFSSMPFEDQVVMFKEKALKRIKAGGRMRKSDAFLHIMSWRVSGVSDVAYSEMLEEGSISIEKVKTAPKSYTTYIEYVD